MSSPAPPRRPAREVVTAVVDPEMPVLTLDELGVIRAVDVDGDAVTVLITPTYTGCPAITEMCQDIGDALRGAGYGPVEVRTVLSPPWSTDMISETGLRKLAEAGIAPPRRIDPGPLRPLPLAAAVPRAGVVCPNCGASGTEVLSAFGPTPCTELRRCSVCLEPFEHVKEI
ncbi:MAG TPA: 1,2-phenylacetyl-CoA epoxidase subunit PaaD [Candidatus Dormibacteraeota bacterium]|nr:1,2-phenylacetyl-CoA epoxidase subunit PaaD [Candidatus Dormibacteraeota bacterium]